MSYNTFTFRDLYYGALQMVKMEKDSNALIQAKQITNDALIEIANIRDWVFLDANWFFSTETNRYEYALPNDVDKVFSPMWDMTANVPISQFDQKLYDKINPNMTSTGDPSSYMFRGMGIANQPYSFLSFVSDDASDTTQTITIYGWSYGRYLSETITLTGDTPVSSSYKYLYISKVVLSAACTGTITCSSNSAGVTNFTIAPATLTVYASSITQPSDVVSVVSTNALDVTPKKITIIGSVIAGGVPVSLREDVVLTGATPALSGNRFNTILGITKSLTTGTVVASGHVAVLWAGAPLEQTTEHLLINLIPCPSSVKSILVRYKRKTFPLSNDNDPISPFPQKFAPAIKHYVASYLYDYLGHNTDKAITERNRWLEARKDFMYEDDCLRGTMLSIGSGETPLSVYDVSPFGGTYNIVAGS